MKTKFPAMVAGAAFGALVILGATTGQAAAGDYRDGGHRYGGRGDFHWDDRYHGHDRYWGRRDWYGPRWYGPPRYRGPQIRLYVPPPVVYYPPYPVYPATAAQWTPDVAPRTPFPARPVSSSNT